MELLLAMFVISVGLFSAVTLVYSNLALVDRDTDEVVVVNMAREGVELAKEARDSNWLAGDVFDAGLLNGTDYTASPVWDGVVATPSFDFTPTTVTDADAAVVQLVAPSSAVGFFANANATQNVTGSSTGFRRLLTFHPICNDQSILNDGTSCAAMGNTKVGIRVESHIQWTRKGNVKDFTMYSDLYDWR